MSITERIHLKNWNYDGPDHVKLVYSDDEIVFVTREDFNRAFGAIINASKEEVIHDFAIEA